MEEKEKTPRLDSILELGFEDSSIFVNPCYDSAIIGYDDDGRIIYDYELMAEYIMEHDGMEYEEAVEFIDYNVIRTIPYMNDPKPVILHSITDYVDYMEQYPKNKFDAKKETELLIKWIKDWFEENGKECNAVIGISGGKDSTIVAALCTKALGKDRVIGIAMPDEGQGTNGAEEICNYLGIRYKCIPIDGITSELNAIEKNLSPQSLQNIPPRARMTVLYAIAQNENGRVVGTCNYSENYIGYMTIHGDNASDMEPLGKLTVTEVKEIGRCLGLPDKWVDKIPDDGLPNSMPDEEKFGFTYEVLDKYIRTGICEDKNIYDKINNMHNKNLFKLRPRQAYEPFC